MIGSVLQGTEATVGAAALSFVLCELVRSQYDGQASHAALHIIDHVLQHYRQFPEPQGSVRVEDDSPVTPQETH